jgi:hypothetical protein
LSNGIPTPAIQVVRNQQGTGMISASGDGNGICRSIDLTRQRTRTAAYLIADTELTKPVVTPTPDGALVIGHTDMIRAHTNSSHTQMTDDGLGSHNILGSTTRTIAHLTDIIPTPTGHITTLE